MTRERATIVKGFLFTFISFVIFAIFYPFVLSCVGKQDVGVVIDADISAGTVLEVYFNADWSRPSSMRIKPGQRFKYRLTYRRPATFRPEPLTSVRMDITDVPHSSVKIHAVTFFDGAQKVQLNGAQLASSAALSGVEGVQAVGKAAVFMASTNDPFLTLSPTLGRPKQESGGSILRFVRDNLALGSTLVCLVLISILEFARSEVSISVRCARCLLPWLLLAGLPCILVWMGLDSAAAVQFQSVDLAVGNAVYLGYPKNTEYVQLYRCVGISVLWGVALGALYRWFFARHGDHESDEGGREIQGTKRAPLGLALISVLVSLLCVKDIAGALQSLRAAAVQLDYDSLNIETWNFLFQQGFLPFKDFWFPYGFSSFAMGRAPEAMLAMVAHSALLYVVLGGTLFLLFDRQLLWAVSALLVVLSCDMTGIFRGVYRYFIALDLVLFFAAVVLRSSSVLLGVVFGIFGAYCTIFEPSQSLYALPAFVLICLYSLFAGYTSRSPSSCWKPMLAGVVTGAILLGIFTLYIWHTDQLQGLLVVYSRLGSSAVSSSIAGDMPGWLAHPLAPEGAVLIGSLLLIAFGIFFLIVVGRGSRRDIAIVVLAIGLTAICIFGKHLVRPHMANQFIGIIFVGAVLLLWVLRQGWSVAQVFALSAWLGIILYATSAQAIVARLARTLLASPRNIERGIEALDFSSSAGLDAYRYFFSQERLSTVYPIIPALSQFRAEVARDRALSSTFFVLGDEAFLYNVFGQKPPPFISFYNSSDVRDQMDIVQWLETERPSIVVWNSKILAFDGVPNVVRVPLIFRSVMNHYRKVKDADGFWLLVRDDSLVFEPALWYGALGREVNLGALPSESSIGQYPLCGLGALDTQCRAVIRIARQGRQLQSATSLAISILQGESEHGVDFTALSSRSEFFIRLDRLWFSGGRWDDVSARLVTPISGFSVTVEGRRLPDALLY
jgi:hypothetical protein